MTKMVQQPSAVDQPLPEVTEEYDGQQQSSQASSTTAKVATMTTTANAKRQSQLNRRTSTRLTSVRNDSLSSVSSSSSSSSSSAGDLETLESTKSTPTEEVFKVPPTAAGSGLHGEEQQESGVICRLPLDRLQAILGALNILKNPVESETSISSSPSPTYKLLCLYCDRTFTTQTLMAKHIDRVHRITKERRSSSRVIPTVSDGAFPNCSYCNKIKVLNPVSEDLSQLFKHLVDQHSDRYFACELCALRFSSDDSRDAHMDAIHQPASNPESRIRPKSKAALKSFNLKSKKCEIVTTPLTIKVDFDTEAMKNLTIENIEAVDSLSAALGLANAAATSSSGNPTRLRSSGRTSARSLTNSAGTAKAKVFKKSEKLLIRSTEPMLSRLGIAQHRTPRQCRKAACAKSRRKPAADQASSSSSLSAASTSQPDNHYNKITKLKTIRSTLNNPSGNSESDFVVSRGKNDIISTFDDDFYENVNLNVRQNLSCHLDGKLEAPSPNAPSPMSPVAPVPAIRSTVARSPLLLESKIHEATNLPALTVFPTLLTVEQYGTDLMPMAKMKKPITKNSWKWKWDFVKKYKYVSENGKIVKKVKQPTLGLRDLSKLDMWTQLTMRTKHEKIRNCRNMGQPSEHISDVGDSFRREQRKQVDQLNQILDNRLLPQINLEQEDQSIVKLEQESFDEGESDQFTDWTTVNPMNDSFISCLQLLKLSNSSRQKQVVLSGEWARPRCYVCYCCGDKFNSLKQMEEHKTFRHPYVYSTYYEIVGRELIEKQLFKHFYIPLSALTMHRIHYARLSNYPSIEHRVAPSRQPSSESTATITEIKSEDSSSNEATSFSTTTSSSSLLSISGNTIISSTSTSSSRSALDMLLTAGNDYTTSFTHFPPDLGPVQCSKCQKECVNTLVLYAHILNCTNDYIWLQAKKRMKYRRANRRRKGCTKAALAARKAHQLSAVQSSVEKSETASNHSGGDADSSISSGGSHSGDSETKKKPSPPRPKDSDSDIVKRLTANLPAKRVSRQIFQTTKQVRKRAPMNMVKGKKQVIVSTLAPSKAGVPRGAAVPTKLRSGKIASIVTGGNKNVAKKLKPMMTTTTVEAKLTKPGQETSVSLETKVDREIMPENNSNKESDAVAKDKNVEDKGVVKAIVKKKVVPCRRSLPLRGKTFVTRGIQWKGKRKMLPFRKGLSTNSRTLRSGLSSKLIPTVKNKTKKRVPPVKKDQEDKTNSPEKIDSPKRKTTQSPVEKDVPLDTKPKEVEEAIPDGNCNAETENVKIGDETVTPQIAIDERCKPSEEEIVIANIDVKMKEVPDIRLENSKIEKDVTAPPVLRTEPDVISTPVQDTGLFEDRTKSSMVLKNVPQETPDQPILLDASVPLTPVKSPSQGSQPPSVPSTPACSSALQINKRKPKKLNDCIAMLTGKLSEKLGVDFFNQAAPKNASAKDTAPTVETRSTKEIKQSSCSLLPIPTQVSAAVAKPLHVSPPQLAPLPLVMNTRHSSETTQKPQMLSPVAPIITPIEDISDEPLNLSKNSPIGRNIPNRTRENYGHQNMSQHRSPPPQSPTSANTLHMPPPQQHHTHYQHQHQYQSSHPSGPSASSRSLPSIKLPPGLIIERVEYKSRPIISKEAPSVTIVARRQPPPSVENRSAMMTHSPVEPPATRKQQQHFGDPRKSMPSAKQLPSPKQSSTLQHTFQPAPSIASTLRQERPLENRISVTITEAKGERERQQCSPIKQPAITLNIPERPPVIDRTSSAINPTPLIIPVPVQSTNSNKRNRRKSIYMASVPVSETLSSAPSVPSVSPAVTPSAVVPPTFLTGLQHLPFLPHSLLTAPPLGLDLQRLANVGLPPHLKPPIIPPLTIPTPPTPATAAAAALLEKILLPNREAMVKQLESSAAQSSPIQPVVPKKTSEEVTAFEIQGVQSPRTTTTAPILSPPMPEKKGRSRSKASKLKTQSIAAAEKIPAPPASNNEKPVEESPTVKVPGSQEAMLSEFSASHVPVDVQNTVQQSNPVEDTMNLAKAHPVAPEIKSPSASEKLPLPPTVEDPKSSEAADLRHPTNSSTPTPGSSAGKTTRKRRKNELASILSDQLLESFKEVDRSALQDLKMMHDMSCEKPDVKFSLEQIPQLAKRKVNPRKPDSLTPVARQHSPVVVGAGKRTSNRKGTKEPSAADHMVSEEATPEESGTQCLVDEMNVGSKQPKVKEGHTPSESIRTEELTNDMSGKITTTEAVSEKQTIVGHSDSATEKKSSEEINVTKQTDIVAPVAQIKPLKRRTRKLSIDIERMASLERKGRQKTQYSKAIESLDIAEKAQGTTGVKAHPEVDANAIGKNEKEKGSVKEDNQVSRSVKASLFEASSFKHPTGGNLELYYGDKSRSKTPFPFPPQRKAEKTDLDRLKDSLNIETTTMVPMSKLTPSFEQSNLPENLSEMGAKSSKRKSDKREKLNESLVDCDSLPSKKQTKELSCSQATEETPPITEEKMKELAEESQRTSPSHIVAKKAKPLAAAPPPKRIMARRSSVFVDKNLARYMEEKDDEQEKLASSTFKDDLILTSRRTTRSQGGVDLSLVASFAETAMKPRDPRRKSAAAVAAAAASAKRAEEERKATAERERKRREEEEKLNQEEIKRKEEESMRQTPKPTAPARRISARRASLFIANPPEVERPKEPEENLAEISKATKRQYRRRASVYQPVSFLDEEEQLEKANEDLKKTRTTGRSKTPGPFGGSDQNVRSVGRRRNQTAVFNGTPEPTIESLLEPLDVPGAGTKRRTKNSQIAENLSKLFNLEEEIQLIDRSRRKPRRTNTPVKINEEIVPLASNRPAETNKIDQLVKVVENEVAKVANISSKPRESLSFSNDDEDDTPKINKLVEDVINKADSGTDSDDDNMSLACFVRREEPFLKPNLQQLQDTLEDGLGEDESNSAMDDDISVTTDMTGFGGSIKKRKRRKSICVTKCRRPKAPPAVDDSRPVVTYNCDLCKKVFKKQDAFNKHRMTLSHIAKLSEQEYLEAQQKEREAAAAAALISNKTAPIPAALVEAESAPSVESPSKELEKDSPMKTLSQEEKLFYECCSMLKESNADNENLNLTVSLKSDEICANVIGGDNIPPPEVSVTYPNPFAPLPQQDKTTDNCFNMGDSFPSFQDVSESENYIQTINQRYADKNFTDPFAKLTAAGLAQQAENDGNLSPQNSTKSTSSQASVFSQKTIKTKGALKGYDNFKVSIPMSGIHIGKESKLDTLADVALCGDIPKDFNLKDSEEEREVVSVPEEIAPHSAAQQQKQTVPKGEEFPRNGFQTTAGRSTLMRNEQQQQGNKLGFRAKKKGKSAPAKATGITKRTPQKRGSVHIMSAKSKPDPDDIYAFQDSPPAEATILPGYTSSKKSTANSTPTADCKGVASADHGEESQLSSLSFSDRDDFVYGTNTLSEEDEDDKSSSYSSTQTVPKKPIKADVQKKSLIMGRIFKKVKDNKAKDEACSKKAAVLAAEDQTKPVVKDFDKLFDTLKKSDAEEKQENKIKPIDAESGGAENPTLEEFDDEKEDRNLRKRSAQKKLAETWDSDEFEDFNLGDVEHLIDSKDGEGETKRVSEENVNQDVSKVPETSDGLNQGKQSTPAKGKVPIPEKKATVTDESIRQVMESVIMEVSMNKNNRVRDIKRRGKGRPAKATTIESAKVEENKQEKDESRDSSVEAINHLEEHVLESSVVISSKTITTKFKQKLNSAQSSKQKQQAPQLDINTDDDGTKSKPAKTVNNNNNSNQKNKTTPKAVNQRKDPNDNKTVSSVPKAKPRKGAARKMKNVAYDPDSDFEDNIKCKKVKKKLLESDIEANLKIEQLNATLSDNILMPAPRRKRNAAETLYFWSSSSEEDYIEDDYVEVSNNKSKKKKGAGAKQKQTVGRPPKSQQKQQHQKKAAADIVANEAGDDTSSSSEHMQQHGWIVGDSHKKLVTLLAHAKGKQDNRTVKATGNKRKT
ncbi:uncharacterized protein LOC129765399 [Toxorhynchites rutilus septentrionalis]|uniref:uncharacterized protein LOC129765399 n=1 Tax=Toxorhynchites rutilus septentrionalis TaxID=329112 RepID=UPI0024784025|nr:uncharacterized protein LOC129765399 [Toxorhynchites rutilus septentrionalis]XP_055621658.1 uncharacterized protein LOC129765399 [Toxorhynchites rutilus septentrionalis]XP_055621659.1 uncharacterized protein LOC129765399 [Toxorhynchites rutilus septentrionalis]XP_055621660.1 uncharacterized protein LOC129765399 [Toxorhynchites rutilus septentrionalis]